MSVHKKTKIVATIGPATQSEEMLSKLLIEGFNVMRLNFSHGDFAEHQGKVDNLKKAIKKTGIHGATLQDLGGPKIRIGDFENGVITLKPGQKFTLTTEKIVGNDERVSVNYEPLPREVKKGGFILLHDGKKKLEIVDIKGKEVICKVIVGGETKNKRGINLPGAHLSISSLTDKDKADLEFGIKNKVDFVAFSFVRRADDIRELRALLDKAGCKETKIIAKVEDCEGVENIDEIIELVDGVMVARGDMGIEVGVENVPVLQKTIIKKCNEKGKVVITATHILESMIKAPVPTRAEVSDIANAVIDGTDAIMLSEETTLGDYPIESVRTMATVARNIEQSELYKEHVLIMQKHKHAIMGTGTSDAVTNETVDLANAINAKAIVALTQTGKTAQLIARYKPLQPIFAFTSSEKTHNQLLMSFGVTPVKSEKFKDVNDAVKAIKAHLKKEKVVVSGDKIVIVSGTPIYKTGTTNTLIVETI
ncbi:MAG: pyruvate kinase [Candidatus Parcubacteria bacterium]|jgi:pyruvate kinase